MYCKCHVFHKNIHILDFLHWPYQNFGSNFDILAGYITSLYVQIGRSNIFEDFLDPP